MVRCQCQNKNRTQFQTCAQREAAGGEQFLKMQEDVLNSGGGEKPGGRETWNRGRLLEDMCAFEPWERKSDQFYFLLFWQTTPLSAMPSPTHPQPHWGSGSTLRDAIELQSDGSSVCVCVWGGGHSHTQEWNISCGFISIHNVLICCLRTSTPSGWHELLIRKQTHLKPWCTVIKVSLDLCVWAKNKLPTRG